ncbi:MAG: putative porin [Pseudomonadales bacterium]|nr:putative porin [Pseudomonadales bacterium]
MMKMVRLSLMVLLVWSALAAADDGPLFETNLSYSNAVNRHDAWSVGGSYFFRGLDTSTGPVAEAAFLSHTNRLTVRYADDGDHGATEIGGRWLLSPSGWFVDASAVDGSFSSPAPSSLISVTGDDPSDRRFSIGVGKYVLDRMTVAVNYERRSSDFNTEFSSSGGALAFGFRTNQSVVQKRYGAGLKYVGQVEQIGYALSFDFAKEDTDVDFAQIVTLPLPLSTTVTNGSFSSSLRQYGFTATIYPLRELGLGVSYDNFDASIESSAWGLEARWFVTPGIAIEASWRKTEVDAPASLSAAIPMPQVITMRPLPPGFFLGLPSVAPIAFPAVTLPTTSESTSLGVVFRF